MYCLTFFLHVLDPVDSSESSPVDRNDAMDALGLNITMSIVNVGAQGYPGTGKTSLLDLAMGKDPAGYRNSIGGIDPPSRYLMVKSLSSEGVKWDHVTSEKMFDMVCDAVKETINNPPEQVEMSRASTNNPALAVASQPEIPASLPDVPADNSHVSILDLRTIEPVHVSSESASFFLDLLKQTEVSKGSGVIFDSHWMMVTDSGGQPPFLDTGALFLRNNSLQIFCLKLNEPLNYKPELSYFIDGKHAVFANSDMQLSNQQIIETMAKSVSAFQPALTPSAVKSLMGPRFAVIGTFEDQAHLCSETIEDKESTLDEVLKPYKDFQVRYDGNLILPVMPLTTDQEERKQRAFQLQKLIFDASGLATKVVVKLRWFGFFLSMLTRANKQKRSILALEECLELGTVLEMTESEVHQAIRFFHDFGFIMHFDTPALRNSVIVDSKPLLDKVSLLLTASFLDQKFLANHYGLVLPPGPKELLQQQGRFSPETLENFIKFEDPITRKFFLDVLVEVKAVTAIDGSSEYIMPSALPYWPDDQCVPHPSTPWVIRFRIKRGIEEVFIPLQVGYLPALVVFLLMRFLSLFSLNRNDRQFRNLFVLKYKRGGKVYILERHLQLEIYFTFCEELPGDCIVIRDSIQKAMSLTDQRFRITEDALTKVNSFLCTCEEQSHHVCIYNQDSGIAQCEITDESCVLKPQQLLWIKSGVIEL